MPAAAVIPAPIANTNVAAVKKLVVSQCFLVGMSSDVLAGIMFWIPLCSIYLLCFGFPSVTVKKSECSKQVVVSECISMG